MHNDRLGHVDRQRFAEEAPTEREAGVALLCSVFKGETKCGQAPKKYIYLGQKMMSREDALSS